MLILVLSLGALFRFQLGPRLPRARRRWYRQYLRCRSSLPRAVVCLYGPPSFFNSFTRLSGYPLFLALLPCDRPLVDPLETHPVRATTRMQALLDAGTALWPPDLCAVCARPFAIAPLGASLVPATPFFFILVVTR